MIFWFTLLILSVILISGWSDAAGAITACVSVRSLPAENALRLAAVSTFLGSVVMTLINPAIAVTFYGVADFGKDPTRALGALCAALFATVLWSATTRTVGIPTSESHALVSGMSGAALAISGRLSSIHADEWMRIFLGMVASILPPLVLAFLCNRILHAFLAAKNRRSTLSYFQRSQRFSACWNAALTGAQDCQKFMGVYMLGLSMCKSTTDQVSRVPLSVLLLCAAVMSMGTMLGSTHVIKKVGRDMVSLDASSYSAAGAASTAVMTLCTCLGLPSSITHTRASAFVGAGLCRRRNVDLRVVLQLLAAWILTFPVCALLGFLFCHALTWIVL